MLHCGESGGALRFSGTVGLLLLGSTRACGQ